MVMMKDEWWNKNQEHYYSNMQKIRHNTTLRHNARQYNEIATYANLYKQKYQQELKVKDQL